MSINEWEEKSFDRFFTEVEEERYISTMRIRIEYVATQDEIVCRRGAAGRCWFYKVARNIDKNFAVATDESGRANSNRKTISLNAFEIRKAFENVKTDSQAHQFLGHSGPFWLDRELLSWHCFQECQELVKLVREEGFADKALTDQRAEEAMRVVLGLSSKFFSVPLSTEMRWSDWDRTELLNVITTPGPRQDGVFSLMDHQDQMRELFGWFQKPPASAFSIAWEIPEESRNSMGNHTDPRADLPFPEEFSIQDYGLIPILRIAATNVLEAIAATIYADRLQGIKFGKCEFCGRLFKRESDHGQKYCRRELPDGRVIESCKNAATQKALRAREKEKKIQAAKPGKSKALPSNRKIEKSRKRG